MLEDVTQELDIYTDSSMVTTMDEMNVTHKLMGTAWHIANMDISFQCGAMDFPSSTRAELIAIMTALLAVPLN